MKRKILVTLGAILLMGVTLTQPAEAAGGNCSARPLGFRPWFAGLCNSSGEIKTPSKGKTEEIAPFVWKIVLNVLFDITLAVGYLATAYVIYAGYLYMTAQGDPRRMMSAKKALSSAIIGLVIAMVGSVIVNTIIQVFDMNRNTFEQDGDAFGTANGITGIFAWMEAAAGLVAVAFIVKGGIEYMVSRGDPRHVNKAKDEILYAVVGLLVVLLAAAITYFVSKSVGGAIK